MTTTVCAVAGCDRPTVGRGLCTKHYQRARTGRPLTDPEVGSPDGYGRYGVLDHDGDRCLCHECGQWKNGLGAHVRVAHHMSAREYKTRHGLPLSRGLLAPGSRARKSAQARARVGTSSWTALEQARDPNAAQAARSSQSWDARSQAARRTGGGTPNLPTRTPRIITCAACGARYCPLPGTSPRATCSQTCADTRAAAGRAEQARRSKHRNAGRDQRIRQAAKAGTPVTIIARDERLSPTRIRQILTNQP